MVLGIFLIIFTIINLTIVGYGFEYYNSRKSQSKMTFNINDFILKHKYIYISTIIASLIPVLTFNTSYLLLFIIFFVYLNFPQGLLIYILHLL